MLEDRSTDWGLLGLGLSPGEGEEGEEELPDKHRHPFPEGLWKGQAGWVTLLKVGNPTEPAMGSGCDLQQPILLSQATLLSTELDFGCNVQRGSMSL